jgi:uncharacterized protein
MEKKRLIVFYRNSVEGKVKSRLAATLGAATALKIYRSLCEYTAKVIHSLEVHKMIFYDSWVEQEDLWYGNTISKFLQQGDTLGNRMAAAFEQAFKDGPCSAIIIGTDCPGLLASHIETAFNSLESNDVVIGPASDGGYYLLGMNKLYLPLFSKKDWGTENVFRQTTESAAVLNLKVCTLEILADVDRPEDLELMGKNFTAGN